MGGHLKMARVATPDFTGFEPGHLKVATPSGHPLATFVKWPWWPGSNRPVRPPRNGAALFVQLRGRRRAIPGSSATAHTPPGTYRRRRAVACLSADVRVAVIAYVDKEVRDDLKRMAMDKGTTVQEVIETMLQREIAQHEETKKLG